VVFFGSLVSFTNKTDRHKIAKILLKVALNITNQTKPEPNQSPVIELQLMSFQSYYSEEGYNHNKYYEALNREKRASGPLPADKSTCFLYMQADPKLYNRILGIYVSIVEGSLDCVSSVRIKI
jgi:hypothetical protein